MLGFASWQSLAAIVGISLLAACVQQQAPMAAAPQLASRYQISFDTNRSDINASGQAAIKSIAAVVRNNGTVRVTIIGKTDSVGSAEANMKLSQKRADQVRDALIATGKVPASSINTSWSGESKPEVTTAHNVAETRNRVVDIIVQYTQAYSTSGPMVDEPQSFPGFIHFFSIF
jgi:OOP family OmpA-OmpF porin